MSNHQPDPGWWQCDGCEGDVRPADAETVEEPTDEGTTILAFCEDCSGN